MTAYLKNQLVWAKVKGYPWWPATIARPNQTKNGTIEGRVLVNFVGEKTHATVALDKIADYDEKFKQYSSIKSKKLQEAVKAAQRKLDGFSSEEESSDDEDDDKVSRLLRKKASRDSSSVKSVRHSRTVDSVDDDEEEDDEEEEKPRGAKVSRLSSKIKEKEVRAIKRNKSPVETEAGRFTRSRSKTSKVEMLTEPLIYTSRKSSRTPPPVASLSPGKRNNSKRRDSEATENTRAQKPARTPTRPANKGKLVISTKMLRTEEKIDLEDESVITTTNSDVNDGPHADKKTAMDAEDNNNELNMMLQDVEENDDSESFQLNEDSIPEEEVKKSEASRPAANKRAALGQLEGLVAMKGNGEADQADRKYLNGYIIKKVKPNEEETAQTRIRRIENSLQQILNELSGQFKANEKLEDSKKLAGYVKTVQEIENCSDLTGAELISSELGKLTKTLHFLLSRNAGLLCETGQTLTVSLAKILHKIKSNILKFCLDNTNYIETFQLTDEQEKTPDHKCRVIDIESEETKVSIVSRANTLELDKNNSSLTTAMDDEDTNKFQRTIIETITSPSLNKEDSVSVSPGICKPEPTSATSVQKEEEEHKRHEGVTDFQLRKKICQKFTALLQKSFGLEKEKSNELTRKIESRIINNYGEDVNDYKQAIKQLLKLIKADLLKIDDLTLIHNMSVPEFKEMMDEKLKLLEDDTEGSEANSSLPNNQQRKKKDSRSHKEVSKEAEDDDQSEEAPRRTPRATGKTLSKPEVEEQLIKKSAPRRKSVKKESGKSSNQGAKGASRLRSGRRY